MVEVERKQLLKDMEDVNRNIDDNLNRHKAMVQANWDSKLYVLNFFILFF